MDYYHFNQLVLEHRNSMIAIGIVILTFITIGIFVVEFYVRRKLDCPYFQIGNFEISPTWFMIVPLVFVLIYFPIKIEQCNYDINNSSYEEYVGEIEYSESSVKLIEDNISIFVGKGHEIVPRGTHYGKIIYSSKARVIVSYEPQEKI